MAALTVWGAYAERVCVPEVNAVEVPDGAGSGRGGLPRPAVHDGLSAPAPHGDGSRAGRRAGARRGRQGGQRRPRARSAGRGPSVRHGLRARPRHGRAAGRGGDRLPQRGLRDAVARAPRKRGGRRARRARRRDVAALVPGAAARRTAGHLRPLRDARATGARAGEDGSSGTGRPRASRSGACSRPVGGCSPTGSRSCAKASKWLPVGRASPSAGRGRRPPRPGVVPGGLPHPARAAPGRQDPSGRRGAPAARGRASRARATGAVRVRWESWCSNRRQIGCAAAGRASHLSALFPGWRGAQRSVGRHRVHHVRRWWRAGRPRLEASKSWASFGGTTALLRFSAESGRSGDDGPSRHRRAGAKSR